MSDGFVEVTNERGQVKKYETVAARVLRFREANPTWSITTHIIICDDEVVRMRAEIGYVSEGGAFVVVGSGHAEEYRTSEGINATSALENCETSAIGRALSACGFGSPDSYASAEEVLGAVRKGEIISQTKAGAIVVLQEAAKKGTASLQDAWETKLGKEDRQACRGNLSKLKRMAAQVDAERREYERSTGG